MSKLPQSYTISRCAERVVLDANWDKPVWQHIKPLVLNYHMGEEPDHRPNVRAKLAWDEVGLTIIFRVEDRYVRALAREHQGPVYKDSCVEFFFTPGSSLGLSYFNLEINCGGTMLFWWHPEKDEAIPVSTEDCERIEIAQSLPKIVDSEITEPTTWTVEYRLPFALIKKYCPDAAKPKRDVAWRANFYKCADETSHPHWLTWSYVENPTPQFHLPQYFGKLMFI